MAKQTHIELIDDIDPSHTADVTVPFSLDGHHYEIDLANVNADKLRDTLAPWIAAARKAVPTTGRRITTVHSTSRDENKAIRAWAESAGLTLSERGRIPADVIAAYRNRNNLTDRQRVEAAFALKQKAMDAAKAAKAAQAAAADAGVVE